MMSLVSLDVGGKLFKTSLETLNKYPASKLAGIVVVGRRRHGGKRKSSLSSYLVKKCSLRLRSSY